VFSTHEQETGSPTAAIFLHVPDLESTVVQSVPPLQTRPPILETQGPAPSTPTLCRNPGKPVSFAQVLAWVTAVNTVTITSVAIISTNDDENAPSTRRFRNFEVAIMP